MCMPSYNTTLATGCKHSFMRPQRAYLFTQAGTLCSRECGNETDTGQCGFAGPTKRQGSPYGVLRYSDPSTNLLLLHSYNASFYLHEYIQTIPRKSAMRKKRKRP